MTGALRRACIVGSCALGFAACSSASNSIVKSSPGAHAPLAPATPAPAVAADLLAACPATAPFSALRTVARVTNPDDIAVAPDGTFWVTDAATTLTHVSASGTVLGSIDDRRAPEGVVTLASGTLLLAEQGADRVVALNPATHSESTLIQLTPRAGVDGVDGIGIDASQANVLVPDSANGTLLSVALQSGAVMRLASNLGRPVSAAITSDGAYLVAAENARGLLRVPAGGGTATPVGSISDADDVLVSGGIAYVTSLSAGEVSAVDVATGRARILVTGVSTPQGLARAADGTLLLADSQSGRIVSLRGC